MNNKLSIIIPTFKEGKIIESSVNEIITRLKTEMIDFEILVIDDHSNDQTIQKIKKISSINKNVSIYLNSKSKGFGNSLIEGIKKSTGKYVCFVMADQSDSPEDIIAYYKEIVDSNSDCVFGNRWEDKGLVEGYPFFKYYLNRIGNIFLAIIFRTKYSDITNSFKMYKKTVLFDLFPFVSNHFSITVEIPLKVICRGYKFSVIPNSWRNNEHTVSNLNIGNILITYSLVIVYCLIERFFQKEEQLKLNKSDK